MSPKSFPTSALTAFLVLGGIALGQEPGIQRKVNSPPARTKAEAPPQKKPAKGPDQPSADLPGDGLPVKGTGEPGFGASAPPGDAPAPNAPDDFPLPNNVPLRADDAESDGWQHFRVDVAELATLVNRKADKSSAEKGLNILGGHGYRLFAVTTLNPEGGSGWHLFKRAPWHKPEVRPKYEYKRIDDSDLETLGGSIAAGLDKIGDEGWELVAVTTRQGGGVGFYYFERKAKAEAKETDTEKE